MKHIIPSFIMILFAGFAVSAQQITNSSFETWSNPKTPDGWFTYSSISTLIDLAHKDTTDKVEGAASAKIETTSLSGSTIHEILSLGTATQASPLSGGAYTYYPVAFSSRPDTFFFAYKYSSPGTDTGSAYIRFTSGSNVLLQKSLPLYKNTQWSYSYILLTSSYANANNPDSLLIQFQSSAASGNNPGTPGSVLNVDALRFGYSNPASGIQDPETDLHADIFPNPARQYIHADCRSGYQIFSSTGALIRQSSLPASTILIDDLPAGLYILKCDDFAARFSKINE